jgi:hypothetical protein
MNYHRAFRDRWEDTVPGCKLTPWLFSTNYATHDADNNSRHKVARRTAFKNVAVYIGKYWPDVLN